MAARLVQALPEGDDWLSSKCEGIAAEGPFNQRSVKRIIPWRNREKFFERLVAPDAKRIRRRAFACRCQHALKQTALPLFRILQRLAVPEGQQRGKWLE